MGSINKEFVREICDFAGVFFQQFENFMAGYGQNDSNNNRFSLRVSGAIEGILLATSIERALTNPCKGTTDQVATDALLQNYRRYVQNLSRLSGFNVYASEVAFSDEFLLSTRRAEPQMTLRLQSKRCMIELFVLIDRTATEKV